MQANKDFILFDEPASALQQSQPQPQPQPVVSQGSQPNPPPVPVPGAAGFPIAPSAPINVANPNPASFTQHRSHQTQSPLLDDVGMQPVGAAAAAAAQGDQPFAQKRQRAHGYSSSWNGLDSRQLLALQQAQAQAAAAASASNPPPGLADSTSPPDPVTPVTLKDPPSGSLGAPMHDLSLVDSSDKEIAGPAYRYTNANGALSQDIQERVKAQIRAELAGVDSRAFKGPLRDILQQKDYTPRAMDQTSPLSAASDPMQAGVAPTFSLFPDYDVGQSQASTGSSSGNKGFPSRPETLRRRSSSFDSSYLQASSATKGAPGFSQGIDQASVSQWTPYSSTSANAASSGPSKQPVASAMPPPPTTQQQQAQAQLQAQAQTQLYRQPPQQSVGSRRPLQRESSGLTVSPQQAFLDYDEVESALEHSGVDKSTSLFAPVPPGLTDTLAGHSRRDATSGNHTPKASRFPDESRSGRTTPGKSDMDGYPHAHHRIPMSRNETARPHHYPKRPGHRPHQPDGRGSTSQESGSQSSLFSPSESFDTTSTDDDEDERPYYPSNMRPSMIRGGPSSLYLNYPAKPLSQASSNSSSAGSQKRPSLGKERSSSSSGGASSGGVGAGAGTQARPEPWMPKPHAHPAPRFSDVSASSSDSDEDRLSRSLRPNGDGRPPLTQQSSSEDMDADSPRNGSRLRYRQTERKMSRMMMPGAMGGYGYIPGSQESGLSVAPRNGSGADAGRSASGSGSGRTSTARASADDVSMSGSQDDGSQSPSIRSSAQVIDRQRTPGWNEGRKGTGAGAGAVASAAAGSHTSRPTGNGLGEGGGLDEELDDLEGDEEEEEEEDESDYEETDAGTDGTRRGSVPQKRRRKSGASEGSRKAGSPPSRAPQGGGGGSGSAGGGTANRPAAGTTGSTRCDYRSPITGQVCQTAFHRPYDLARHRETIHAREEASFIREGKLRLEDCIVLGKEVDPKKSMAVVEWKCKTCGASFSRKDAMLRHERLRHSAGK